MHYTNYTDKIKKFLKAKNYREAEKLLTLCVELTEKESQKEGCGVAPWYYEQLANIYSDEKRILDEIRILERYNNQKKAPGMKPKKLKERLLKLLL